MLQDRVKNRGSICGREAMWSRQQVSDAALGEGQLDALVEQRAPTEPERGREGFLWRWSKEIFCRWHK